jgi:dTDP-4-dehydrorhamnose reductase
MTKAVIIGASSSIGVELMSLNPDIFLPTYYNNKIDNGIKFDICNDKITKKILVNDFNTFIILSAISNPKYCENNEYNSININVHCMKKMIDDLILHNRHIVFFSSEYVYSGKKGNFKEDDDIDPINKYGNQKYDIEKYIIKNCKKFCILRLGKTYSLLNNGKDFHSQWYRSLVINNVKEIRCFSDQIFSPLSTFEIFKTLKFVITNEIKGIYNLAGSKSYSRMDCLNLFIRKFNLKNINIITSLIDNKLLGFQMPKNVSMDISKITSLGIDIKSYEENLYEL